MVRVRRSAGPNFVEFRDSHSHLHWHWHREEGERVEELRWICSKVKQVYPSRTSSFGFSLSSEFQFSWLAGACWWELSWEKRLTLRQGTRGNSFNLFPNISPICQFGSGLAWRRQSPNWVSSLSAHHIRIHPYSIKWYEKWLALYQLMLAWYRKIKHTQNSW
jgi:hypothetical protein